MKNEIARRAAALLLKAKRVRRKPGQPVSMRGANAFGKHVTRARMGQITDWSWAEKEEGPKGGPTKESVQFQLKVAEDYERKGGRPVTVDSTAALKDRFGMREVQSGNWVLRDVAAAKFHTERTAEAFADLADIVGVPDAQVSLNGRLALAFGARGKGGKNAARAHYESVHRVINLTKMGGGGALAHEWFHAMDNIVTEMATGAPSAAKQYAVEDPTNVPDGELRAAFKRLNDVMHEGAERASETFEYTDKDLRAARFNVDQYGHAGVGQRIKSAASAVDAVLRVKETFAGSLSRKGAATRMKRWITMAVAYHDAKPEGGKVSLATGPQRSSFAREALKLDGGTRGKYWSSTREMAARAFQSYVEDRLAAQGRRNDYLSAFADNKFYADPLFGQRNPFPEGAERSQINRAFDHLFEVMRRHQTLQKALERIEMTRVDVMIAKARAAKPRARRKGTKDDRDGDGIPHEKERRHSKGSAAAKSKRWPKRESTFRAEMKPPQTVDEAFEAERARLSGYRFLDERKLRREVETRVGRAAADRPRIDAALERIRQGKKPGNKYGASTPARGNDHRDLLPQGAHGPDWRVDQAAADKHAAYLRSKGDHVRARLVELTPKHVRMIDEQTRDMAPAERAAILDHYGLNRPLGSGKRRRAAPIEKSARVVKRIAHIDRMLRISVEIAA